MEYPKALQPTPYKKDGKVISWRAIYADLDEEGRRKRITWKSFPVKYKDDNGVNRTNSKNSVFQATVKKCEELKSISSDSLIDTSMTLMQFIEEHFEPHRKSTAVANCLKPFKRYLRENGWANIRLNKVTKSFCRTYRAEIINFKMENGKPYKSYQNLYIRLVAELSHCLKLAEIKKYVAKNYNERLENPNKNHRLFESERAKLNTTARTYKMKSWTEAQLIKWFPKLMAIPETRAEKVMKSNQLKPREANVRLETNAYKTYWKDADGKYCSKRFNINKYGKAEAKKKADALAEIMTAEIAKEYEDGSESFYLRERRTFDDVDIVMVRAYFTLSLYLGLRNGEICGLKFLDFDEEARTVDIQRQLTVNRGDESRDYDDDKMLEVNPKKDSFRVISYDDTVQNILDELKAYHILNEYTSDDYLLQGRYGGRIRPDYWTKHYAKFQDYAGIPKHEQLKGTHSGRHTHLSILAKGGLPIPELQYRAGHNDIDTTARYYIHIANDKDASSYFEKIGKEGSSQEQADLLE